MLKRLRNGIGGPITTETKNKMSIVTAQFGKRLGEEFTVKYQTPKHRYVTQYRLSFEEKGLIVYGQNKDTILRQLLTGQAMIVNN